MRLVSTLRSVEGNTWLFFLAQGLSMTTLNINIIIVGLAGLLVAPEPWLATLPLSMQFVASMLSTLPASLLMGRIGRKPVFLIGIAFFAAGMAGQGLALLAGSFAAFMVSAMLVGFAHGIAQFYRYAAADSVAEEKKPVVVSLVLAGGLIAAFAGATIVNNTLGMIPGVVYASCFFTAAALQVLSAAVILSLKTPPFRPPEHTGRPLGSFFRKPRYVSGLVAAALGFSVMSFVMTAAPLQIVTVSGLTDTDNALIIQWHVIAMFLPSFFTGVLIQRFGADRVILAGLAFYSVAVAVLLAGTHFWHYFAVLMMVGFGWNALYVTGSSVIAASARPEERAKVQGMSDFIITMAIAISSLSAGTLHYLIGWEAMGIGTLVPVGIILLVTMAVMLGERRKPARP